MSLVKPPPQTDEQWVRQTSQRLAALEQKQTTRVGDWVLHSDDTGNLLATKPGADPLNVGNPAVDTVDLGALRGFVTDADVALAVSGGKTQDLNASKNQQVIDGAATGNAQYTADNAQALAAQALASLESGPAGVAYNDSFDRPAALDFGPDYDMSRNSAGNNYGTLGDGTTGHTSPITGVGLEEWRFRYLHDLNTNQQRVGATLTTPPQLGQTAELDAQLTLAGRVDSTRPLGTIDGRVEAIVEGTRCCIGYYLGGGAPFVNLSGWQACGTAYGDSFDFWIGLGDTGHDRYKFALLRNTLTVATADDIPENTSVLLANRQGAVGVRMAVTQFFFLTQAVAAPGLQSVNFADRNVA